MARRPGTGEQPSITDRDPGDESRACNARWEAMANEQPQSLDAAIARINELKVELTYRDGELNREKTRTKFWHDLCTAHITQGSRIAGLEAENAKLRADLAKCSRSQTVQEGSFW